MKFFLTLAFVGYILIGFLQMAAIYSFFSTYWGWWFIFAGPASLVASYTPFLGATLGVFAAHAMWKWGLIESIFLFFWPVLLYVVLKFLEGVTFFSKEK